MNIKRLNKILESYVNKDTKLSEDEVKAIVKRLEEIFHGYFTVDLIDFNSIDIGLPYIPTKELSKAEYENLEKIIADFDIETDNYELYGSWDISGYEYWNEEEKEDNFIYCFIRLKNNLTDQDYDEIEEAVAGFRYDCELAAGVTD